MSRSRGHLTHPLILTATVVVVVVVVVTTALVRRHRAAESSVAASLEGAGLEIHQEVELFRRTEHAPPLDLRLQVNGSGTAVVLVGNAKTITNTVAIPDGMRLEWYSDRPDPRLSTAAQHQGPGFCFCLSRRGHYWRLNTSNEGTATRGDDGACPTAPRPGAE